MNKALKECILTQNVISKMISIKINNHEHSNKRHIFTRVKDDHKSTFALLYWSRYARSVGFLVS